MSKFRIVIIVSIILGVLIGSAAGFASINKDKPVNKAQVSTEHEMKTAVQPAADSGVVTCQEMADRATMTGTKPKLSFADVRAKFEASKDAEIRTAGVKLVDTLVTVDKTLKSDGTKASDSLGAIMAMRVAWMDLQEACEKHGVIVPDLKA